MDKNIHDSVCDAYRIKKEGDKMYFPKPAINENDIAIIERGDTAEHSIEAGQYVSWKGKLGKANAAILQGATLDDSLFSYDDGGALNYFKDCIIAKSFSVGGFSGGGLKTFTITIPEGYSVLSVRPLYTFASGNESLRLTDVAVSQSGTTCSITAYVVNPSSIGGYSIIGAFLIVKS